uniref:Uncharacterized protein n=1 Tax=Vespula pensylvanica TaxID=30213 RepID=A0A834P1E7_VESPE|nr:hypothetical protein H0235_009108 [Vespula pensylvanica]
MVSRLKLLDRVRPLDANETFQEIPDEVPPCVQTKRLHNRACPFSRECVNVATVFRLAPRETREEEEGEEDEEEEEEEGREEEEEEERAPAAAARRTTKFRDCIAATKRPDEVLSEIL